MFGDLFSGITDIFSGAGDFIGDLFGGGAELGAEFGADAAGDAAFSFDPEWYGMGADALGEYAGEGFDLGGMDFGGLDPAMFGMFEGADAGGGFSPEMFAGFGGAEGAESAPMFDIGTDQTMAMAPETAGTGGASASAFAGPVGPEGAVREAYQAEGIVGADQGGFITGEPQGEVYGPPELYGPPQGAAMPGSDGTPATQSKDMLERAWKQIQDNPLSAAGLALGAAGMGMQGFKKPGENERALRDLARQQREQAEFQNEQARSLLAPLTEGAPLPAGQAAAIKAKQRAAEAAIRSQYANMGIGNSTMRQSAIQQAGQQAGSEEAAARQGMARAGADILSGASRALGGATSAYDRLLRGEIADDEAFQGALANLAKALGSFGQRPVVVAR